MDTKDKDLTAVEKAEDINQVAEQEQVITKQDVRKLFFRWYVRAEVSNSFERLQSLAFCASISPALEKLYKTKEGLKDALKRHLQFFNTEGIFGAVIHGTVLAMEEQKAKGEDIPGEMITNIKTGLMGAMAGIGDTLTWGTLRPILLGLAASFAMKGSPLGVLFPFLFVLITYAIGNYLCGMGYRLGKDSVKTLLQGGKIKDVIYGAGIMGMFMMGALAASYVDVSTAVKFTVSGEEMVVQDILDGVVKGLLPLTFVMGTFFYLKKRPYKILEILLIILAICFLGAFTGVL